MAKVAILGYGTVGSGIYDVLTTNSDSIEVKAGEPVEVKYVLDLREFPGDPVGEVLVHDFQVILNDPEVEVVAEAMGGLNPAYEFAKSSLEAGKSYCTSNKELVEKYGPELIALAKEKGKNFLFEASVGGGIPLIRPMLQSLTADKINSVTGILNGTTNYILTKMCKGLNFDVVLKEAQEKGYAERNPVSDVEGYDACRKIAILASLAFGKNVDFKDIYREGITKISDIDLKYAGKLGMAIKLLGDARKEKNGIFACVAPMMIDADNPLYGVNGVYNSVMIVGNKVGKIMFFGSGAGKLPTASAVAADVVEAVKFKNKHLPIEWSEEKMELSDFKASTKKFFVRISGNMGEKKEICENAFGACQFVTLDEFKDEFAIITQTISEYEYMEAAEKVDGIITSIRIA